MSNMRSLEELDAAFDAVATRADGERAEIAREIYEIMNKDRKRFHHHMQKRHGYKARWCDEQIKWAKAAAEGKGAEAVADTKEKHQKTNVAAKAAKNKILTEAEKAQIIAARDKKQPAKNLAKEFGVVERTIDKVYRDETIARARAKQENEFVRKEYGKLLKERDMLREGRGKLPLAHCKLIRICLHPDSLIKPDLERAAKAYHIIDEYMRLLYDPK